MKFSNTFVACQRVYLLWSHVVLFTISDIDTATTRQNVAGKIKEVTTALRKLADEEEKLPLLVLAGEIAVHLKDIDSAREFLEDAVNRAPANEKVRLTV